MHGTSNNSGQWKLSSFIHSEPSHVAVDAAIGADLGQTLVEVVWAVFGSYRCDSQQALRRVLFNM